MLLTEHTAYWYNLAATSLLLETVSNLNESAQTRLDALTKTLTILDLVKKTNSGSGPAMSVLFVNSIIKRQVDILIGRNQIYRDWLCMYWWFPKLNTALVILIEWCCFSSVDPLLSFNLFEYSQLIFWNNSISIRGCLGDSAKEIRIVAYKILRTLISASTITLFFVNHHIDIFIIRYSGVL